MVELMVAYFAGGCFWGVEYLFQKVDGVERVESGYMGGTQPNPSYEDIIYRNTGHLETVQVTYNPNIISYEELVKYFFEIHNFSQTDGQGPDIGYQYLSAVFVKSENEKEVVNRTIETLQEKGFSVATKIIEGGEFYKAEDYHQNYYNRTGKFPYCHSYKKIF